MAVVGGREAEGIAVYAGASSAVRARSVVQHARLAETQREVGIVRKERQQVVVQEVFRGKAKFQLLALGDRKALLRRQIAAPVLGTHDAGIRVLPIDEPV